MTPWRSWLGLLVVSGCLLARERPPDCASNADCTADEFCHGRDQTCALFCNDDDDCLPEQLCCDSREDCRESELNLCR